MASTTISVNSRSLIARINRVLSKQDEVLRAARGSRMQVDVGDYYIVDFRLNAVVRHDVDPEQLGRKLGVLRPYERIVTE